MRDFVFELLFVRLRDLVVLKCGVYDETIGSLPE
jgi:hypothetical protein